MEANKNPFILSLTSHVERFASLGATLTQLRHQTLLPEKVLLNLSAQEIKRLPREIREIDFPVEIEINETTELGPGTKIIPTLNRFPKEIIVTVDDDHIYDNRLFETLWKHHLENPQDIIVGLGHSVKFIGKHLSSSVYWDHRSENIDTELLFNTGAYGALFPPESLHHDASNADLYREMSYSSVSPWLWINALRQQTRIRQLSPDLNFNLIPGSEETALSANGNVEIMWDYNLQKMWGRFDMDSVLIKYVEKFNFDLTMQQADFGRPSSYPIFADFESNSTIPSLRVADILSYLDFLPPDRRYPFVREFRKHLVNSINLANQRSEPNPNCSTVLELQAIKNSRIWRFTKLWRVIRDFFG